MCVTGRGVDRDFHNEGVRTIDLLLHGVNTKTGKQSISGRNSIQ